MIKNFDVLAGRLKGVKIGDKEITADLLKDVLSKDDPFEIVAPEVHILDDAALNTLKESVDKDGYKKGKDAGYEMLVKEMKEKAGIETAGKSVDVLLFELSKKIEKEKGVEPNKKISELSESLTNLQKQLQAKDGEISDWQKKHSDLETGYKIDRTIQGKLPKNLKGVNGEQFATLFKAEGYSVSFGEDGLPVPTLHGKVLKDKYEKPLSIEAVQMEFATKNSWLNGDGRGDGDHKDTGGSLFKSEAEVYGHMEKNNIDPLSTAGQTLLQEFKSKA